MIFLAEVLINLAEIGVVERRCANIRNEVVGLSRLLCICGRPELKQGFRNRIRDGCPLRIGWYASRAYGRSNLAEPFPRTEEKRLIFFDRSAERAAILIAMQRG